MLYAQVLYPAPSLPVSSCERHRPAARLPDIARRLRPAAGAGPPSSLLRLHSPRRRPSQLPPSVHSSASAGWPPCAPPLPLRPPSSTAPASGGRCSALLLRPGAARAPDPRPASLPTGPPLRRGPWPLPSASPTQPSAPLKLRPSGSEQSDLRGSSAPAPLLVSLDFSGDLRLATDGLDEANLS